MRRRAAIGAAALAALGALASPASAVTISASDTAVLYTAAPDEINGGSVTREAGGFRLLDSTDVGSSLQPARVVAEEPCRLVREPPPAAFTQRALRAPAAGFGGRSAAHGFPAVVDCPARPSVIVRLGDQNDGFGAESGLPAAIDVDAGDGNDSVVTGASADTIAGGPGRDQLAGGTGADRLDGGPGEDTVRYDFDQRRSGIEAALGVADAGSAEDGPPGQRDTLSGFEHLTGTIFGDRLTGDAGVNELTAGAGPDRLTGAGGADAIVDGPGRDRVDAGAGADRIESRDGDRDRVVCDGRATPRGDDDVVADAADVVADDCDAVTVAGAETFGTVVEVARQARTTAHGSVVVRVSCTSLDPCTGTVRVQTPGGSRLGRRRFSAQPKATAAVSVRLSGRRAGAVRRARRAPLVAVVRTRAGVLRMTTTRRVVASRG